MAASLMRKSARRLCPLPGLLRSSSKKSLPQLKLSAFNSRTITLSQPEVPCQVCVCRNFTTTTINRAEPSSTTNTSSSLPISSWKIHENVYSENHIPTTRQSIIHHLVEEIDLLTETERNLFPDFVRALDTALVNRYQGTLDELKVLFDPCNPDNDSSKSRQWSRKEKLDNEYYLLQFLEDVMAKANFQELAPKKLEQFLKGHESLEKVRVSVDPSRYDVLRFWVLGHEVPKVQLSALGKVLKRFLPKPSRKPEEYYKRVVVAVRLKKDSKLTLKAFKEVPVQGIEMLLPDGNIQMRALDKGLFVTSASLAGLGVLTKVGANLAGLDLDWTLVVTLLSGASAFFVWSSYTDRRNAYLTDLARLLYFKNIGSNKNLLALLVDRAQDESLKEALLAYVFLLNSQPHDLRNKIRNMFATLPPGRLTAEELAETAEKWLEKKTGSKIKFDSVDAIKVLLSLGLVSEKDNKYHAVQLDTTAGLLPHCPASVIARRGTDVDITEGYDRDKYLESAGFFKDENHKSRRYGWF